MDRPERLLGGVLGLGEAVALGIAADLRTSDAQQRFERRAVALPSRLDERWIDPGYRPSFTSWASGDGRRARRRGILVVIISLPFDATVSRRSRRTSKRAPVAEKVTAGPE